MPRFDNLDKIVNDFAVRMEIAQKEIIEGLMGIVEGATHEEATIILSGLNIEAMTSVKVAGALDLFDIGVGNLLVNTYTTSIANEQALRILLDSIKNDLSSKFVNAMPQQLLREVTKGISLRLTPDEILKSFTSTYDYEIYQLEAIINTSFSQYSNSLMNLISDKLPANTLYIYIGPNDEKTRDECVARIKMGPVTKQQIKDSEFGNLDNAIWNCRHGWEELSDKPKAQGYRPEEFKSANA